MIDLILIGEYHIDVNLLLDSIKDAEAETETWKETLKFNEGCWREERETMIRKLYAAREENESLREQLEDADEQVVALEKQVKALMREYEPMRKDAERYRWLRASDWYVGTKGHHCDFSADQVEEVIDGLISSPETP